MDLGEVQLGEVAVVLEVGGVRWVANVYRMVLVLSEVRCVPMVGSTNRSSTSLVLVRALTSACLNSLVVLVLRAHVVVALLG